MKQILFLVLFIAIVGLIVNGCATHPTTIGVGSTNGNVSGTVTTQITTNIDGSVSGSYDPSTGDWTAAILVTFKDAPSSSDVDLATAAGAVPTKSALQWIYRPDLTNDAQTRFVESATRHGATISKVVIQFK